MTNKVITPENVEQKTWTKETVHNYDVRFTEWQMLIIKRALELQEDEHHWIPTTDDSGDKGDGYPESYWNDQKKLRGYIHKILKVRYSTK